MSTSGPQSNRPGLSVQTTTPMFFPPPPTSTKQTETKKPMNLCFKSRPSTDSASTTFSLNKAPVPILKKRITSTKRTRQWILLSLLLLSFTILILSVIFAYCAALPHSDNIADAQASAAAASSGFNGPTTSTISLSAATAVPTPDPASSYSGKLAIRDTSSDMQSSDIDRALAEDAYNQSRFSTSSAKAALTFYTATLPLLTMLHTAVELLISLVRPETSQSTRLGDKLRFRNYSTDETSGLIVRRRIGTLLSFSVSTLLVTGWLIVQLFTINCEISPFKAGAEAVCPVQIRGHHMGGVSEISIAKVVLGFLVLLTYTFYCVYLVRVVGVLGGGSMNVAATRPSIGGRVTSSFKRRARFASRSDNIEEENEIDMKVGQFHQKDVENQRSNTPRVHTESVVIGMDFEKDARREREV